MSIAVGTLSPSPVGLDASVHATLERLTPEMQLLLQQFLAIPSISGNEGDFVRFVAQWAQKQGFAIDLWVTAESDLRDYPLSQARHIPLAGRPTLVIRLPGRGHGRSLLFNAHSDVVAAGPAERWRFGPWSGAIHEGEVFGRGACDVKGPLVSALWAMLAIRKEHPEGLDGDVLLELVPGEEDCVGLGTLTSLARGHRADAMIVLEPTGNLPRCASRGGCRFDITCHGRAVHGTVKWLGRDAIGGMRHVLASLDTLERRWNVPGDDPLFAAYPIARPVTVDCVHGGQWQGMVCDTCSCGGYLELLPGDDISMWKRRLTDELREELRRCGEIGDVGIRFSEEYVGHTLSIEHALCRVARGITAAYYNRTDAFRWAGFNSGCEAGLRNMIQGTPTLVWGPGSLDFAHAADERIGLSDVSQTALMFTDFMLSWQHLEAREV